MPVFDTKEAIEKGVSVVSLVNVVEDNDNSGIDLFTVRLISTDVAAAHIPSEEARRETIMSTDPAPTTVTSDAFMIAMLVLLLE